MNMQVMRSDQLATAQLVWAVQVTVMERLPDLVLKDLRLVSTLRRLVLRERQAHRAYVASDRESELLLILGKQGWKLWRR